MLRYVLFIHKQTHNLPGNGGRCPGHGGSYVAPSVVAEKNATRSRLDTHASWLVAPQLWSYCAVMRDTCLSRIHPWSQQLDTCMSALRCNAAVFQYFWCCFTIMKHFLCLHRSLSCFVSTTMVGSDPITMLLNSVTYHVSVFNKVCSSHHNDVMCFDCDRGG